MATFELPHVHPPRRCRARSPPTHLLPHLLPRAASSAPSPLRPFPSAHPSLTLYCVCPSAMLRAAKSRHRQQDGVRGVGGGEASSAIGPLSCDAVVQLDGWAVGKAASRQYQGIGTTKA
eukprot:284915-Chlamydomonas_euryale.AAC.1